MIDKNFLINNKEQAVDLYKKRGLDLESEIDYFISLNDKLLEIKSREQFYNQMHNLGSKLSNPKIKIDEFNEVSKKLRQVFLEYAEKHPEDCIRFMKLCEENQKNRQED